MKQIVENVDKEEAERRRLTRPYNLKPETSLLNDLENNLKPSNTLDVRFFIVVLLGF